MNDSRWTRARSISRWNAAAPAAKRGKWEWGMAALSRQEAGRERRAANAHLSAPSADERSRRGKRSQPSNSNTKSSPMGFWLFRARRGCEQSQQQRGPGEAPPLQSLSIDSGDISVRLAESERRALPRPKRKGAAARYARRWGIAGGEEGRGRRGVQWGRARGRGRGAGNGASGAGRRLGAPGRQNL
jgi:hypothetical protein